MVFNNGLIIQFFVDHVTTKTVADSVNFFILWTLPIAFSVAFIAGACSNESTAFTTNVSTRTLTSCHLNFNNKNKSNSATVSNACGIAIGY